MLSAIKFKQTSTYISDKTDVHSQSTELHSKDAFEVTCDKIPDVCSYEWNRNLNCSNLIHVILLYLLFFSQDDRT